jgi:hypothetical protein
MIDHQVTIIALNVNSIVHRKRDGAEMVTNGGEELKIE